MSSQDCIDAQRVVSETYDGGIVDPGDIQRARTHCETCPECAEFVSTLAAVRRLHTPPAPTSSIDSAIQAIREQKRIDEAAAEAAESDDTQTTETGIAYTSAATGSWPKWAVYASWGTAAATLIIAGVVTLQGVRYIVGDKTVTEYGEYRTVQDATAPSVSGAQTNDSDTESLVTEIAYVTVEGWVYEYVGPTSIPRASITAYGTTLTSLDTEDAPKTLSVYTFERSSALLVDDDGQLLEFRMVTRDLQGQSFGMQSRAVTSFGQWPAFPDSIPEPSGPDGAPQLEEGTQDSRGVQTYTLAGSNEQRGFAIAPGTDSTDPARGNPNWTWWSPVE